MKKFSLLLIFLLIFLFFPFPKNVGPQERPDLENMTVNMSSMASKIETKLAVDKLSPLSLLPDPSSWPRPLYLVWRAAYIDTAVRERTSDKDWTKLKDLPATMPQAIVAIEDHRFYEHDGVDVDGVLRAILANIQADRIVQGGSTLTQQLVKNTLLSQEQTFERKVLEIMLALIVESRYEKDDILEMYLNTTYFGAGAYGVKSAASVYFGKTTDALVLAECAVLAGLPNAPSALNPFENLDACKTRRNSVLKAMAKRGMISNALAEETSAMPILLNNK